MEYKYLYEFAKHQKKLIGLVHAVTLHPFCVSSWYPFTNIGHEMREKIVCNSITPYFENMLSFHYKGITVIALSLFFTNMGQSKSKYLSVVITSLTHAVH